MEGDNASLRKGLNCCVAAKCGDVPVTDIRSFARFVRADGEGLFDVIDEPDVALLPRCWLKLG